MHGNCIWKSKNTRKLIRYVINILNSQTIQITFKESMEINYFLMDNIDRLPRFMLRLNAPLKKYLFNFYTLPEKIQKYKMAYRIICYAV